MLLSQQSRSFQLKQNAVNLNSIPLKSYRTRALWKLLTKILYIWLTQFEIQYVSAQWGVWIHHCSLLKIHGPCHQYTWISNHGKNLSTPSKSALIMYYLGYLYCFPRVIRGTFIWWWSNLCWFVFILQVRAALWEWNYTGWARMAFGSTGKPPGALQITALTSTVPKAFSHAPQALASVFVTSPRYPVGMYIPWWSLQLLRQDWSLLSAPKKYIQVEQVTTLCLKVMLNSICELRLRAIPFICYVGKSKRCEMVTSCPWILATGTSSFFGIVVLSYHMIRRHSSSLRCAFLFQKKDQMLAV